MPIKVNRPPYFSQALRSWVIPLTQGVIALVNRDVAMTLGRFAWCAASHRGERWYAMRQIPDPVRKQRTERMHRVIVVADIGQEVDHKVHHPFGDKLIDNRRTNLRLCSDGGNAANARKLTTKNRYKGVSRLGNKWGAHIRFKDKLRHLGSFADPIEAAHRYDSAAVQLFGRFALTNRMLGLI
mgnify:CR=1 FL=1